MSRGDNWIPLDKSLQQTFKTIRREFSLIEAMYSYSLDQEDGCKTSISGYAKLWGWSRNRVRRFIENIRKDSGHLPDRSRTGRGHAIHFIDAGLWADTDTCRTGRGQVADTTDYPNPNPISKLPKGNLSAEPVEPDSSDAPTPLRCPHKKIQALYNEMLGNTLPYCKVTNKTIDSNLRTRWRENVERQNLEWWAWYFGEIAKSDFLMGRTRNAFTASFDWVVRPKNMTKILNGNYTNRGDGGGAKVEKLSDYMRRTGK